MKPKVALHDGINDESYTLPESHEIIKYTINSRLIRQFQTFLEQYFFNRFSANLLGHNKNSNVDGAKKILL